MSHFQRKPALAIAALLGSAVLWTGMAIAQDVGASASVPQPVQAAQADTTPAQAAQPAPRARATGIGMRDVLDRLDAAGYTDVREIERERGYYKAKVIDAQGRKQKLRVDAVTGEISARYRKGD